MQSVALNRILGLENCFWGGPRGSKPVSSDDHCIMTAHGGAFAAFTVARLDANRATGKKCSCRLSFCQFYTQPGYRAFSTSGGGRPGPALAYSARRCLPLDELDISSDAARAGEALSILNYFEMHRNTCFYPPGLPVLCTSSPGDE